MAPLDPLSLGAAGAGAVALAFGFAFGFVLERGGFGDSRKLAGQFYFRDMTVLKVMFTGIVVAMVLLALTSALQVVDMERVWVNPTHLWPQLLGGFLLGCGFLIGGY